MSPLPSIHYPLHPLSIRAMHCLLGLLLLSQTIELARDLPAMLELQVYPIFHHDNTSLNRILPDGLIRFILQLLVYLGLPAVGILLCAGIMPRIAALGAFLVVASLQHYLTLFLQGGDVLLRLLLFWSIFLPTEQRNSGAKLSFPLSGHLACWAFTLQVCFVYWFAAALKNDPVWTQSGDALFYALNLEHFTTSFGLYLRQYPDLLRFLSFSTRYFEFIGPFLLLIPVHRDRFRMLAIVLFVSFHLIGMQSLLRIGIFPWVCSIAWVAFLPGFFWNWMAKVVPRSSSSLSKTSLQSTKKAKRLPLGALDITAAAFVTLCFLDILAWNVASLDQEEGMRWMDDHDFVGRTLGLRQEWNMYAPHPKTVHGWLMVPAHLTDGTQVDLFTGKTVSWSKPTDIGAYLGDNRWRRYLSNLFDNQDPEILQIYAHYLIQQWNEHHAQEIQDATIIFMRQETNADLENEPPQQEVLYFSS